MRLLLALLLFMPLRLLAAVGDITGAEVETNGWVIKLYISGLNTNGNFFNGFGTNNSLTATNALTLTLDSMGFNDAGVGIIKQRTVYGTKLLRMPYPSQLTNDIATDGDGCIPRIALSEYVYASDSNLTLTVLAGGYAVTNGDGTNCTLTAALATTNGSVQPYPSVIGNWSWRGFRVIDEEYMTLRAVAFHKFAEQGRPVRSVMFWVTDSGGDSFTNWTTQMVIDKSIGDANPVQEYIARFATNTLASGFVVCNVRFYPWIGDAALDSSTTGYLEPTPYLCPLTNAVNYPRVRAIVSNAGNDTTGVAYDETFWATNTSPPKFLSIGKAMVAIYATNNGSYSRAGWGGGIIYLEDGNYGWFGSAVSLANAPSVELLVQSTSGSRAAYITNALTDTIAKSGYDIYRLKDLNLSCNIYIFQLASQIWAENCMLSNCIAAVGTYWVDGDPSFPMSVIVTGSTMTNCENGVEATPADGVFQTVFRGNRLLSAVTPITTYTFLGNTRTAPTNEACTVRNQYASMVAGIRSVPGIAAYNTFYNLNNGSSIGATYNMTNGFAMIQNVWATGGSDMINQRSWISGDNAGFTTNVLVWNNLYIGADCLMAYNDLGSTSTPHYGWSLFNNIFDATSIKGDTRTAPLSGTRIGGWPVSYGVGSFGNRFYDITNITLGNFSMDWNGLYGHEGFYESLPNPYSFVSHGGWDGITQNPPPGNMCFQSSSEVFPNQLTKWVLPFDIEGNYRGNIDPAGAYSAGNARKGGMF